MYSYFVSTYGWDFRYRFCKSGETPYLNDVLSVIANSPVGQLSHQVEKTLDMVGEFSYIHESRDGRSVITVRQF